MIKYIGKTLLLEEDNEKVLVIGDLHIGYDEAVRRSGVLLPNITLKETEKDVTEVLTSVGKVSKIVLLGDLKHSFGLMGLEWKGLLALFEYLKKYCKEIIIIKGNHDSGLEYIANVKNLKVEDFFVWKQYVFLHGDRDFKEIYRKDIEYWIVGHAHPAVWLVEGAKREKFKCFLVGNYKGKKVVVIPSFFSGNEGSDPRENVMELAWPIDLVKFEVVIVGENLETLEFGKLSRLPR